MRAALALGAALAALALLPGAAQAKNCGRVPLGEGSGTTAGTVITRNLSCTLGISILDRWRAQADRSAPAAAARVHPRQRLPLRAVRRRQAANARAA